MADDTAPDRAKPIPRRLRYEIFRRDDHTCQYCGGRAPDVSLTVDHVIPRALGGGDDPTNLVTACTDCNAGKASTSPDENRVAQVADDAFRWAAALAEATTRRRKDIAAIRSVIEAFDARWDDYGGGSIPRDMDWRQSIETFAAAGLDADEIVYFVDVAMASKASFGKIWRYFCGCCWNGIRRRQEIATNLVHGDQPEPDSDEISEFDKGYEAGFDDGQTYAESSFQYRIEAEIRERVEVAYMQGRSAGVDKMHRQYKEYYGVDLSDLPPHPVNFDEVLTREGQTE